MSKQNAIDIIDHRIWKIRILLNNSKIARGWNFDAGMGNAWTEARFAIEGTIVSTGLTSLSCAPARNT